MHKRLEMQAATEESNLNGESGKVTAHNFSPAAQRNFAFTKIRSSSIDAAAKRGMFTARNPGIGFDNSSAKNLVSVSQIRQSRHKVELDVMRLHNRI